MAFLINNSKKEILKKGFFDIPFFAHEILELDTHPEQDACLNGMRLKDETAITCGNRWGKGDTIMIYFSWFCTYKPIPKKFKHLEIPILNTSISQDQANIVFDKFIEKLSNKKRFSWLIDSTKKSPFPHIKFKTNVDWWFRNSSQDGKFLEGRAYALANFDEADLQRNFNTFIDDTLSPRLWDFHGSLIWTTTPRRGKKNAYIRWSNIIKKINAGNKNYFYFQGDSRVNKFLDPRSIEKMNLLPTRLLNRNVKGEYEDSDGEISNEALDYCENISTGIQSSPTPGITYINVWDFARSSTFNVGITLQMSDPLQLVSWERKQDEKNNINPQYWKNIEKRVIERSKKWRGLNVIDGTGIGDVIYSHISEIKPIIIKFSSTLRKDIIDEGISVFQSGGIGIPPNIEQVINGELWTLRDEIINFDSLDTNNLIWDFVCCLFMGIWISKGNRPKVKNKPKKAVPRVSTLVKGSPKNVSV